MRFSNKSLLALTLLGGCSGGSEATRPPLTATPTPTPTPIMPERETSVPLPPDAGAAGGPAGTSGMGAARYDQVGFATWYGDELARSPTASGTLFAPDAITAAHRTLPLGSHAEITALDTGRTILVLINDRGPGRMDREIDLSRGAAALLGLNGQPMAPVRVRGTIASPADIAAIAAGRAPATRLNAPPGLLVALRAQLKATGLVDPRPSVPAPVAAPMAATKVERPPANAISNAPARGAMTPPQSRPAQVSPAQAGPAPQPVARPSTKGRRYLVQVVALSNADRAGALARTMNGRVESDGGLHRVRLGPFSDLISAQRARDDAARRGYGDATILVQP